MTTQDQLGAALGRIPSGLFIVTTVDERGVPMGFLGSFVQQVAIDPPTVMVAISPEREHLDAVRASRRFAISILGDEDKGLMKPFFKKPEDGSPFDDVAHSFPGEPGPTDGQDSDAPAKKAAPNQRNPNRRAPYLDDALAWLDCRMAGEHNAGDHVVIFGIVEAGSKSRDGEPLVHTRKSGLGYA